MTPKFGAMLINRMVTLCFSPRPAAAELAHRLVICEPK
jgi:hypothetical protein